MNKPEINIFSYLNNIFYKQDLEYDKKIAPSYMVSMWLSHDSNLLKIINRINKFHFLLKDDIIYKYYYDVVAKGKRYLKWVKKDEKEEKIAKKVNSFREETGISKKEANNFLYFIKKDDILVEKKKIDKNVFFE